MWKRPPVWVWATPVAALVIASFWFILDPAVEGLSAPALKGITGKDRLIQLNAFRTILIEALGALTVVGGLLFTARGLIPTCTRRQSNNSARDNGPFASGESTL